jgi:N-methylhydantoinase A/oxoprolinase/acetone carboxylase beta subunit
LHACALAEELGSHTVVVPAAAGVLSALGLAAGEERRDAVRSYLTPLEEAGGLPAEGEADLRYAGQSFELTVPLQDRLSDAFHRAHEERYGYADRDRAIELVAVRTAEVRRGPSIELRGGEPRRVTGPALIQLDGSTGWVPGGWEGKSDQHGTWIVTRA